MEAKNKSEIQILVVDDEPGMRDMLSYELGLMGFKVQTASDGLEAIEMVRKKKFHLIVSDIKMPRMDGLTALEEIKKIDPSIEVIMATGFGTIDMAVEAMKKGAYDFIQKPYNLSEVGLLIEKALEKSDLRALIGLYESSRSMFSTIKLAELLKMIMGLVQRVLSADEGSLMLLNEERRLYIASSIGMEERVSREITLGVGERIAGLAAAQRRELLLINGLKNYPEFAGMDTNDRLGSSIVIPLVYQEELLGVLNLSRHSGHVDFTSEDLRNASIFSSQVAQAVQNAKLYQTLENKIDELKAAYQMLEETKDRLVESEKLASIGKLVSGVAHELNNPLTAVLGYAELLLQSEAAPETREQLNVIFQEAQRCRQIVQDLLIFARRREPVLEKVELSVLIRETLNSLSLEIQKNGVQISENFFANATVSADPCQLQQVFMNILVNAMQALSETDGEKRIKISLVKTSSKKAQVIFEDNGPGIEEKNLSKIFDPFFSTKGVGKGTGLGLSLSYGIIKQINGNLFVQSKVGQGATFTIELPLLEPTAVKAAPEPVLAGSDPKLAGKSILVVDDEESIRRFLFHTLSARGLKVDLASDVPSALLKLEQRDYDVILTDFLMPKLNGDVLFAEIQKSKPALMKRVIFMTGDAEEGVVSFFKDHDILNILKPFRPEELLPYFKKIL